MLVKEFHWELRKILPFEWTEKIYIIRIAADLENATTESFEISKFI